MLHTNRANPPKVDLKHFQRRNNLAKGENAVAGSQETIKSG